MADTDREVTREEIEALAAKLSPALESFTEEERDVFAYILERAGEAGAEVSGFAAAGPALKEKSGMASTGWANRSRPSWPPLRGSAPAASRA